MYHGEQVIPEAIPFIQQLIDQGIPHLFVTNNSTKTSIQVAERLNGMGIAARPEDIFTSSMATAAYMLSEGKPKTVYAIGETGLKDALKESGFTEERENPAYVVVGMDTSLTYEKAAEAVLAIRNGATFISTNADAAIPTERGLLPGNGSITALVAVASETKPLVVGKPERIIMDQALARLGVSKDEAIMVGDNYDTDILAGINSGMDTLLVLTGFTNRTALAEKKVQPTFVIDKLTDWEF